MLYALKLLSEQVEGSLFFFRNSGVFQNTLLKAKLLEEGVYGKLNRHLTMLENLSLDQKYKATETVHEFKAT